MKATNLWIGASVLALSVPGVAFAQPSGGTAPAEAPPGELQDIIVTASKVEANVQKLPLQIQTLSGEQLLRAGVTQASDLNRLAPGVQVQDTGGGTSSLYIRGIGSAVLNAYGDPANAFSVDGVYFSRSSGPGTSLFDIARIEILKGPQGTLYGRNATGGAFSVVSNRPSQKLGAEASLEIGNYSAKRFNAAVNLPLSSTLAARVAGQSVRRDGYFSDGYDDAHTDAVRGSLLWKPTSTLSVFLSGDYAHVGGKGLGAVSVGPGGLQTTRYVVPGDPRVGPSDPRMTAFIKASAAAHTPGVISNTPTQTLCLAAALPGPGGGAIPLCSYPLGVTGPGSDGFTDNDAYGANLTIDADLGIGTLTAIAGYRGTKTNIKFAIDSTQQSQATDVDQYSGELRLASKAGAGPFKWLVGAFWLKEQQAFVGKFGLGPAVIPNPFAAPGSPLPATTCLPATPGAPALPPGLCITSVGVIQEFAQLALPDVRAETYAGFGQVTYSLTDTLRVTGGLRYTHDSKSSKNGLSSSLYVRPAGLVISYPSSGDASFNNVSGRASVEFDVAPRSMLYAAYSTAYHAGGFNLGVPDGPNQFKYKPEYVKSYTLGIKNRFFNNTLQLNIEGFYLDYTDLQVGSIGLINDGSTACSQLGQCTTMTLRTDNAGRVRFYGFETDVQWRPWRGGTIFGDLLYNNSKYLDFSSTTPGDRTPTDYAGQSVNSVVKWTATFGINQQVPIGASGHMLIPEVRSLYKSGTSMGLPKAPANYQKAYTQTEITLTLESPERRWAVGAFVRNLENHTTLLSGGPAGVGVTQTPFETFNPPRTYGVTGSVHF